MIRKAQPFDVQAIKNIAESLRINYRAPQPTGFLVYVLGENEYKRRISITPHFYVSEGEDGELEGFLMAYDNLTISNDRMLNGHQENVLKFLLKQPQPFVFGDQIGVRINSQRTGIGRKLVDKLIAKSREKDIHDLYVDILHMPVQNHASIDFCRKLGFKEVEQIQASSPIHFWGVYHLTI